MRPRRTPLLLLAVLSAALAAGVAGASPGRTLEDQHTLVDPYQPSQQTLLDFGERSHWLQPWRGYLTTVPASKLAGGLGIVFNPSPGTAKTVANEVAAAGLHHARLEISWCRVSYADPERLTDMGATETLLGALKSAHIRPLILLNANHACPGPLRRLSVRVVSPARASDTRLVLDSASAQAVVPGHTGLDSPSGDKAAAVLFTRVDGTTVTLSRPLGRSLQPGPYAASTLRYAPFVRPGVPSTDETLAGWVRYVGLVTSEVKRVLGSDDFDLEVWNELSFGSDFLNADTYYSPPVGSQQHATEDALLGRTIAYVRDPSHGLPDVGVGDGFASQRPWDSGSNVPQGVAAIDKHPYPPRRDFPGQAAFNGVRPLDALGRPDGTRDSSGRWRDSFIPSYTAFFPEYFLSGIQTETVVRDLSPITTDIYGTPHGRATHPPGASPPAMWLTETGMDPSGVPDAVLPSFHAKGALRWATAWVNKGASRVYFYAASSPGWGLVDPSAPGGGLTLRALGRLNTALTAGAGSITKPRSLELLSVTDQQDHLQFAGDGTAAHPPLYDRDVVGFFPFQVANGRVVIAVYVTTRDLLRPYQPGFSASDPRRYDLPPETVRLTIGGVSGLGSVTLADPLTDKPVAARVVSTDGDKLVVDVPLTDSPRLLTLSSAAASKASPKKASK